MSTISEFSAPVPEAVREALAASGAPFDPVGTAILFPEHTGKPDIVVIWRKGSDVMTEVERAVELAEQMRVRLYLAFECPRLWAEWRAVHGARH